VKICFVGAGVLGCTIGGTLAKGGSEVSLVDLNKAHVEAAAVTAVAEAMAVAKAQGVVLSIQEPRDAWVMAAEGLPFEFKPSVLQSLERGLTTEVDFINGSVVRAGKACGIPTPVDETLVACIKGIEHRLMHFEQAPTSTASR
jgi:ketopantoate reductase